VHQPQVRLVHQRSGVEHGVAPAAVQPRVRQALQLRVDDGEQRVARRAVAGADAREQNGEALAHSSGFA
jgi:hypothetical protein